MNSLWLCEPVSRARTGCGEGINEARRFILFDPSILVKVFRIIFWLCRTDGQIHLSRARSRHPVDLTFMFRLTSHASDSVVASLPLTSRLITPSTGEAEPRGSSCVLYDAYNTFRTIPIRNVLNATNEGASGVCRTVQVVQS